MDDIYSDDDRALLSALVRITRRSPKALVPRIVVLEQHRAPAVRKAAERALIEIAYQYTQSLASYFHVIPWDEEVLEREDIAALLQEVREATDCFQLVTQEDILRVLTQNPRRLLVFRLIFGFLTDHLAVAVEEQGVVGSPALIKAMEADGKLTGRRREILPAIASVICRAATPGALRLPDGVGEGDFRAAGYTFDTVQGWDSIRRAVSRGVPYDVLLYQRYVGGFERQVRDMYSEKKGDLLERPLQKLFSDNGVPYYRSARTEKIPGFPIAPDFLVPSKEVPELVVEAKMADNGGTARDKAARIHSLSEVTKSRGLVLIAVVDGYGFRRHLDVMVPIVRDTNGLTFSASNLQEILRVPGIAEYVGQE